jgi:GntR family transcriptional repressor for pyruvate dehydrogenase complex
MTEFIQLDKNNLSQQIAEQIENLILSQKLKVGEKLPGEIELAEKFGSSRNVLREAMTTLKERGLVEVRPGNGAFVVQPDPLAIGKMVDRYLTMDSISVDEVFEVRMALEVRACGLAAEHADKEGIEKLKKLLLKMECACSDGKFWAKNDMEFHLQIALMTKLSLMSVFLQSLINIVFKLTEVEPQTTLVERTSGLEAHKEIVKMIEARNRSGAERAMVEHLQKFLDDIIANRKNQQGERNENYRY